MAITRIVRVLNWLLLAAGLLLVFAVVWYVWLPTPKTSGELSAPVSKDVRIVRDARGVPHITAATIADSLFAQGFATAQDRLWQMDMLRRVAAGELSEVAGKAALESDIKSRKLRMRAIAEAWTQRMPAKDRAWVAAYARGVNHYIETNRGKWGPEFRMMSYEPRPWTMVDSMLCALQMNRTLSGNYEQDLLKRRMLAAGKNQEKVDYLFPVRSGDEPMPGSNAWAISGAHTVSGKPLLANDPHLEWSLPSTWYMVHLQAPGLNVAGSTLPGVPAVVIGHNDKIAWGITSLQFDNMDLYEEKIDLRSGQYIYKGQTLNAHRETEWIAVKGERPVQLLNLITVHGPLMTSDAGTNFSLRWSAMSAQDAAFPMVDLNQAGNWDEFRGALKRFPGPNINMIYADTAGNIGWQVVGRLPRRNGFTGNVPLDGASGAQEWDGMIPFDELPSYYNPPGGMVVSANQNSFPANYAGTVSGFFASTHRARAITAFLKSKPKWTAEEMLTVQRDVYSSFLALVSRQAVQAVERSKDPNPAAAEGVRILKAWNGQVTTEQAAPFVATLLYQHLRQAMAEKAAPNLATEYKPFVAPAAVERLLRERPAGWFEDYDRMLANELADAVEEARRIQGRNSQKWQYGRMNEVKLVHPVMSLIPWAGSYFNVGTIPMHGTGTSIKATTPRLGPSMRFVADLSNWDSSLMNLTIGESGHILSWHYKDQWQAYLNGTSYPLEFGKVQDKGTLTLRP
ncbi:MAG: penicillin acylase family protein [Bryobacterales bacterium]|nr:penicillin acylase family protein [Bryobacterales bacterium]